MLLFLRAPETGVTIIPIAIRQSTPLREGRMFFGPDDKMGEVEVGPGDFIFIPKGEIHGSMNVSDTEPSEMVACYIGVNSPDETGIVFVDPPKK